MLRQRNPFPQVGSYALYDGEGATTVARVLQRIEPVPSEDEGALVKVSLVERPEASGYRTLRLADLHNADALGEVEREELRELEIKLHGRKRPRARDAAKREEYDKDSARHEALRLRSIRAGTLDRLLDQLERREAARRAGPFARRVSVYA